MKPVVIRCPNCGTTQGAVGECEACHEAQAGYFCPNHAPGQWLDGPACGSCGARFGVTPAHSGPVSSPPRRAPQPSRSVEWGPRSEPPSEPEVADAPRARSPDEALERVLREMLGGRPPRMPGRTIHPPTPRGEAPEWGGGVDPTLVAREAARGAMGCIGRLVMTLIIFAIIAVLLFGGFIGGFLGAIDGPSATYALHERPPADIRPIAIHS